MKKNPHCFGAIVLSLFLAGCWLTALNGCGSFNSSASTGAPTNSVSTAATPSIYHVETPTLAELAGTYRTQNRKYPDSTIRIYSAGEFVWNSWTDTARTFRGTIFDLNSDGFAVKLGDSSDVFHFQFTPDKHGFFSLDESGNTIEEYEK